MSTYGQLCIWIAILTILSTCFDDGVNASPFKNHGDRSSYENSAYNNGPSSSQGRGSYSNYNRETDVHTYNNKQGGFNGGFIYPAKDSNRGDRSSQYDSGRMSVDSSRYGSGRMSVDSSRYGSGRMSVDSSQYGSGRMSVDSSQSGSGRMSVDSSNSRQWG
ncbi:uncharacterized protein LOC122511933 isoform X4 [Leptopilina heterotoma]|uniref:uncharacterized protein LOC122511933 isoform X4 n=1 Tax=Leptopilina heterotoma TaxID=63436 RepID=UPI001CA88E67|nr:uncharacterized protein LOC122511933 isoform X4 [Leptopilina heterotoma]